jgi:hypothetical protein
MRFLGNRAVVSQNCTIEPMASLNLVHSDGLMT